MSLRLASSATRCRAALTVLLQATPPETTMVDIEGLAAFAQPAPRRHLQRPFPPDVSVLNDEMFPDDLDEVVICALPRLT